MASGRPAFDSVSKAALIAEILRAAPAPLVPAWIVWSERAWRKIRQRRQSAADAGHALQWIEAESPSNQALHRRGG